MSYSKRMMQRAAEWVAANPDPADPFIKIPRRSVGADHDAARAKIAHFEREAERDPAIAAKIGGGLPALRRMIDDAERADAELSDVYAEFEGVLSKPWESQRGKLTTSDSDVLGRWLLTWARSGHNTFDLSQDFVAAMLLTDHRELAIADVRLPFPALLITIPDGFARGSEGGHYTKIHVVSTPKADARMVEAAATVTSLLKPLAPEARGRILTALASDIPPTIASLVDRAHVGAGARSAPSLVAPGSPASPDERHLFIYASDGARALYTTVDTATLTWDGLESLPESGLDDTDQEIQRSIWRIVFGSLAYVTAVNAAIEPQDPAPTAPSGDGKPRVRRWDIGRTIRIAPELVRAARAGSRETAFQVKHRFIVRGHYRNQAHGPERSLRTRRWIAPFWKGPEDGAELVHTYKPEAG